MTSRTTQSIKNARIAMAFYVIQLVLTFVSRKVFIDHLGAELMGLNTTIVNLLNFLNLAELGIGYAVSYTLYKPLHNKDTIAINEIVSLQGYLYRNVSYVIMGAAVVLMAFFPLIFKKVQMASWYYYATFLILLFGVLQSYWISYKQIVLTAAQKNYKTLFVTKGVFCIKVVLQIGALLYLSHGYIYWLAIEFLMTLCSTFILNKVIDKEYPWLNVNIKRGKSLKEKYAGVLVKTKQLVFHKLSGFISFQITPLIIYSCLSLTMVTVYENYQLLIMGVTVLLEVVFNSVSAGVGNLVAEGKKSRIVVVFYELFASRFWVASILCFSFYMLSTPIIKIWLGDEFVVDNMVLMLMILTSFLRIIRATLEQYISAYGLYHDIWIPITNVPLYVGASLIGGFYWGLLGIVGGALLSSFLVFLWKPFFLFRNGFRLPVIKFYKEFGKYAVLAGLCGWGMIKVCRYMCIDFGTSIFDLVMNGALVVGGYAVLFTCLFVIISMGMRDFVRRMYSLIIKTS